MAGPAAVRSGQRRRGRPPGIRAALIVRVRRAAGRVSSVDSSSTMAFAGGCGQAAVVDSGCRLRSATRRPFRSSRPGCRCLNWLMHVVCVHRLDSCQDVNVDVDSRRREISLGNRPVDCTIGSVVSVCSSSAVDGFASAVRQFICRSCRRFECLSFRFFCWWLSSCLFGWWYVFLLSSKSGALACCWCLRSTIVVGSSSSSDGFVSAGRLSVVRTENTCHLAASTKHNGDSFIYICSIYYQLDTLDQYQLSTPQWTKLIIPRERPPWQSKLRRRVNIRH
ncbi:uncharacterized protein LOC125525541 isoform X2 [Triticum urartu]|uniref:uncharacterized protein LOC125525541 isoform X2 n=1 Tax=Triticum urartu TaxID=4572 RepID=UPI0020432D60|nr:uncharacterized protein LOC125525541 isoform X2 [Triticum urartu]